MAKLILESLTRKLKPFKIIKGALKGRMSRIQEKINLHYKQKTEQLNKKVNNPFKNILSKAKRLALQIRRKR